MTDGSSTPHPGRSGPDDPGPGRTPRPRPAGAPPTGRPPHPQTVQPAQPPAFRPDAPPPVAPPPPLVPPGTGYDETILATSQLAVSAAIALVLALVLIGIRPSLWPFAIIVFLAVGGVGVYLAGISVVATRTYVEIGQGRRERNPRRISNDEIVAASAAELTWGQVFGVGLPRIAGTTRTTRMTVRPGPTLVLELGSGEVVRVSTPDPARALAVLGRAGTGPAT